MTSPPAPESVPFARPDITEAEITAVADALRSGWVTSGPQMRAFEGEFSAHVGGGVEAVAVNSATAGLHLALEACGIGPGDEVIVPTWTFTSTAEVVRYLGAQPVLVDVDPRTLNLDLARVAEALGPRTRAVMPVHLAGLGVDIAALRELVGESVRIVEDAAHALPTSTAGALVGACEHSDAAVFSFYATKTITTGEGGMLTTRDPAIAARARIMRLHGIDRDAFNRYAVDSPGWVYDVVAPGFKYNMGDPAAAMGRAQLARSGQMHARRQRIADRYLEALSDLPLVLPAVAPAGDSHAWHLFMVRVVDEAPVDRDGLASSLAKVGIGTSLHFIPLHLLSVWRDSLHVVPADYPVATREFARVLSLPLFSAMTDDEVERVVSAIRGVLDP